MSPTNNEITAALIALSKAKFRLAVVETNGVAELQCYYRDDPSHLPPRITFKLDQVPDGDLDAALLDAVRDAYKLLYDFTPSNDDIGNSHAS